MTMTNPVAITKRLKQRQEKYHYKCVVVGDGGVGKTSLLLRFVQGTFLTEYEPTDYDTFTVTMAVGNEWTPCSMTLVDTAGQETYDRLRTLTYSETDVFIICFSTADRDSFINVKSRWIPELKQFKPKVPVLLVGTQTDLRSNTSGESSVSSNSLFSNSSSHVSTREGKRLAAKMNAVAYAECSALTGDGLDNIFYRAMTASAFPKKKRKLWKSFKSIFVNR